MARTIKEERDRFLAFAFAGADLLIELDAEGRMSFIAGGYQALTGADPKTDNNRSLLDAVKLPERVMLERSLHQLQKRKRIGPIQIQFEHGPEPVVMRGMQALDDNIQRLAFTRLLPGSFPSRDEEVDEISGLLAAESFERLASRHMAEAKSGAGETELTMIHLAGLTSLVAGQDGISNMLRHVGGVLRSLSIDGRSAGQLGEGRFGFIHRKGESEGIAEDIAETIREQGIEPPPIDVSSIAIADPALSENEACKALGHVMRAFAGKVDGHESFASLDDALRQSYEDTAQRIAKFRSTVEGLRFRVHFQPIVKLKNSEISHFEALTRFSGDDSPFELINFAEDIGITQDFDQAVVKKVLESLEMRDARKKRPKIAVNLSTRSLDQDSFVDALIEQMKRAGGLAKGLTFEITESAEITNLERMANVIEKLQKQGHHVALDDFGAGAAAFHYIRALKVNYVKIDGAYIRKLLVDERDASIVAAMIEMCRNLNVGTIAEMVETKEQVDWLNAIGVDCAQGYYFAKPGPSLDISSPLLPTVAQAA